MIVIGGYGDEAVAYSSDGGETWEQTADLPGSGTAHIACDPNCEGTIYAALSEPVGVCGGIYRCGYRREHGLDPTSDAYKYGYYGIAVARTGGALYAVTNNIMVDPDEDEICERFLDPAVMPPFGTEYYSGVARNLTPCDTACCGTEDWDYLICGLDPFIQGPIQWFNMEPSALKICGCLTMDTNSVLWAINSRYYDVSDGSDGSL